MIIIAVDPGVTGAIASIDTTKAAKWGVIDMPKKSRIVVSKRSASGKGTRNEVDLEGLYGVLKEFPTVFTKVIIEKQWGKKGDGAMQAFSLGGSYTAIRMACVALGFDYETVAPISWKLKMVGKGQDKPKSVAVCREMFPYLARHLMLKENHGRADAVLIGEWYRRSLEAQQSQEK